MSEHDGTITVGDDSTESNIQENTSEECPCTHWGTSAVGNGTKITEHYTTRFFLVGSSQSSSVPPPDDTSQSPEDIVERIHAAATSIDVDKLCCVHTESVHHLEQCVSTKDLEKQEEAKLKAKFPMAGRPMSGHSVFLQKRLASRQKYFDSGDYQMAKQKPSSKSRQLATGIGYVTGDAIPTPESVPVRKTSIIQPTKFTSSSAT
uniref:Alpha-endosulfine n=2 Tax=Timema TaxID=61471 RepID=A0A7R9HYJ2_9NEOP|nr:unnamed protein product [Timema bartmani]